jgi:hypothetical protein
VTIPLVAGPYLAAAALLGAAGAAKVARPHDTAVALRSAGVPLRLSLVEAAVRAGALLELAVAVAALVAPTPVPAVAVAVSYAAFTAFTVLALLRRWPIASCGCFGRPDTRPTATHAAVNAAAVAAAAWWAVAAHSSVPVALGHQAWSGVPLALAALVCALLAYLLLTNPLAQARHPGAVAGPPAPRRSS